jgi:FkbM family methyltransferase
VNHPKQFLDHIITQFFAHLHDRPDNNYDAMRFSYDGVDRSTQFDHAQHKHYFCLFLQDYESFYDAYRRLEDERSRKIFVDVILFRLAGHLHIKLDANNPSHWSLRDRAWRMPSRPSVIKHTGLFGPLEHFDGVEADGKRLSVDCWRANLAWTFFLRQYYFERGNVRIGPQAGDYVVDAGACFGDTALAFAATAGPAGRVYAFEPVSKHLEIIRHNLAQNPAIAHTVRAFALGLGDVSHRGAAPIDTDCLSPGFSLVAVTDQGQLPVVSLDSLVREGEIERVDFIKMDIEGYELAALRGAQETLRRFRPRLAVSVYHRPQDMYEVLAFLHGLGLGYKFYLEHYTIHSEETVLYVSC